MVSVIIGGEEVSGMALDCPDGPEWQYIRKWTDEMGKALKDTEE